MHIERLVQARRSGDEELMRYLQEKESSRQQSLDDEEQAIRLLELPGGGSALLCPPLNEPLYNIVI